MVFELIGRIGTIEVIAVGSTIRDLARLRRMYGAGRWRKLKGRGRVRLADGTIYNAELHWYEAHGIRQKRAKDQEPVGRLIMGKRKDQHFAVCVKNDDYPASLELRKIYEVLADDKAAKHGLIRIVDQSGEDYLYPQDYFVAISLPQAAEIVFLKASQQDVSHI